MSLWKEKLFDIRVMNENNLLPTFKCKFIHEKLIGKRRSQKQKKLNILLALKFTRTKL